MSCAARPRARARAQSVTTACLHMPTAPLGHKAATAEKKPSTIAPYTAIPFLGRYGMGASNPEEPGVDTNRPNSVTRTLNAPQTDTKHLHQHNNFFFVAKAAKPHWTASQAPHDSECCTNRADQANTFERQFRDVRPIFWNGVLTLMTRD